MGPAGLLFVLPVIEDMVLIATTVSLLFLLFYGPLNAIRSRTVLRILSSSFFLENVLRSGGFVVVATYRKTYNDSAVHTLLPYGGRPILEDLI